MPDNNQPYPDEALEAPPKLVSALKRLPQEPVFIPPTADEAILRAARRHLSPPSQPRLQWFRFMPWVAAAAAIVLVAAIPQFFKQPASKPAPNAAFARGDLNHDGRVEEAGNFPHAPAADGFAAGLQMNIGHAPPRGPAAPLDLIV